MRKANFARHFLVGIAILMIAACGTQATETPVEVDLHATEEPTLLQDQDEDSTLPGSLQEQADRLVAEGCTYNLYALGWGMDWADAGNIVDTVFSPDSDLQYTFWGLSYPNQADEFRDIVYRAYREVDLKHRSQLWGDAERILVDDVVMVVPTVYSEGLAIYNADINLYFAPFGGPDISRWSSKSGATKLVLPIGRDPITLDTTLALDLLSMFIINQLQDSPYIFLKDSSIGPLAAKSFDVSEDSTVYTVHLREDALWSDGEPVLAQHFVDGVLRLLHPSTAADYAYVLMGIEGAPEYASGENDSLESVIALDDYTFQFKLSEPLSYFDTLLAFIVFDPIRLDLIQAYPETYTQPGVIVSNGAYVLTEYVLGSHLLLEKNPLYWDAENVAYERIEVPIIAEPMTCILAFETGEVDSDCGFPPGEITRWVDRPEFVRLPAPGLSYFGINTLSDPTDDLDFRKALNYAVDRRTINDVVLESPWSIEARGVIPPEIYGYQGEEVGFDYDVQRALEHLQAYQNRAGIDDASEIVLEVWYPSGIQDFVEAFEVMWEENLGIDVRLIPREFQSYIEVLDTCKGIAAQE